MANADQLIELFNEAKAKPAGPEREQFLAEACRGQLELKNQILSLLEAEADEGDSDFLRHSPVIRQTVLMTEKPGDRIGRYKLLQQLGEGGCGVVYMAEQEEPVRRRVALKVIKLGMDTKSVIARFEAERQALALMDHPNIAKVLDAGATGTGRPFFVMELVRGTRITDYCDQNNLTAEQRLELFTQVCHAVQHAHQKGIIHRDLKPSNILVTLHDGPAGAGCPKVIDFGVAKATSSQRLTDKTVFTAFEQFIGTPAYMSPEQAEMSGLDIDTRSDIYSLGVLLYELLTGTTPFDGQELLKAGFDEMRRTIRETEPVTPSTRLTQQPRAQSEVSEKSHIANRKSHIDKELDWIVMKCLEKDRARRYETANGLALDVNRHLNSEPIVARPPSTLYRFQKLVQRNRLAFAAAGAVAVTILLALGALITSNIRITRERNQKQVALNEKSAALIAAEASEQHARDGLFAALKNQARARRYSRQMGQGLESLAALAEASRIRVDSELRDEAIAAMALPDVRRGPKWQASRTNCIALACDAMRQRFAMLDDQGVVTVRRIEDNQELHRFKTGSSGADHYKGLTFSPDGRFLVKTGDGQRPFLWALDSGESILQDAPDESGEPTFSSDRRFVALADGEEVCCFDLATGRRSMRWRTAGRVHGLQFHPADSRIAVGYKDGPWVSVYDATNGREIAQLEVGTGWRMVVSWHPDGRRLAVGSTALGIQVWDIEAQRRVANFEGVAHEVDFLTFHHSGNWLASLSWDGLTCLWETTTRRRAMQIPLVAFLRFSSDGRWLGFFWSSEDEAQLLEFVAPQEYFTLQQSSAADHIDYNAPTTSPDDRLLAVAMDDGVHLWDLPERREIGLVPSGDTESVVFESDGQALWTCGRGSGLQRWTIRPSGTNSSQLLLGPPRKIKLPFTPKRMASDGAVQSLAIISETPGLVATLDLATQSVHHFPARDRVADQIALSPDGKWLAATGWHSDRAQLWDTESGQLVRHWVVGLRTRVAFTPDSRELIVGRASEFEFVKVETLETSRRLKRDIGPFPGDVAFSPDGNLMALEMSPAVIHLKEISTSRTVAQLEDPFGDRSNAICFSRDGTKLIVVSNSASAVHLWDLRAVRARLKTMGLDWDWPDFPPLTESAESRIASRRAPLKVEVIGPGTR